MGIFEGDQMRGHGMTGDSVRANSCFFLSPPDFFLLKRPISKGIRLKSSPEAVLSVLELVIMVNHEEVWPSDYLRLLVEGGGGGKLLMPMVKI